MERSYSDRLATTLSRFADTTVSGSDRRRPWQIVEGVGCIVAGLIVLAVPDRAVGLLAVVLGFSLLFLGGWLFWTVVDTRGRRNRWSAAVVAVVAFATGVCVLAYPPFGDVLLVVAAAIWLLLTGARDVAAAMTRRAHRVLNAVLGAVSVLVAVALMVLPGGILTDGVLVLLVGTGLLVRGILQLVRARGRTRGVHERRRRVDRDRVNLVHRSDTPSRHREGSHV